MKEILNKNNREWLKKILLEDTFLKYFNNIINEDGLFLTELDRKWDYIGENIGTAINQSRFLF